jgi:hypothetical protein
MLFLIWLVHFRLEKKQMAETLVSKTTEQPKLLSFYETIVEMIAEMSTDDEVSRLAKHLKRMEILENHDTITVAWIKRCDELKELRGWYIPEDYLGVPASLKKQKEYAEAKRTSEKIIVSRVTPLIVEGLDSIRIDEF